jgi:integrase
MAGKQGNGEGTVRKRRDGRWEARFVLDDGTRRSVYGKTRQEVAQLLTQMLRDRELGALANTPRQTLDQYLESWLAKE